MGEITVDKNHGQAAKTIKNRFFHEIKPESQLQNAFFQSTGIWCPKPAREWLEKLLENHGFTARELHVAWYAGSLGWHPDFGKRIITPAIEMHFAYGVVLILAIYVLYTTGKAVFAANPGSFAPVSIWLLYLGFFGGCWLVHRHLMWPRRIALRVKRAETQDNA